MKSFINTLCKSFSLMRRIISNLWEDITILIKFVSYEIKPCVIRKCAFLRACCHVLDKGLESESWEPGHGLILYKTAVKLRDELSNCYERDNSYLWVNNVISEYEKAQKRGNNKCERHTQTEMTITKEELMAFNKIVKVRTSCRNYLEKKIDLSILLSLVESAIEAPVGCCRQTVRFFITQNDKEISIISEHVSGMTCFSHIPCIVVVYVHSASYNMEDRRMQYIDASLAVENFILAATAHNLATTICNFTSSSYKDQKAISRVFGADDQLSPVAVISVGYPSKMPRKPLRMNLSAFYIYRE